MATWNQRTMGILTKTWPEILGLTKTVPRKKERTNRLVKCSECGKKVHRDRVAERNLLLVCRDCQ